ncbi:MAG TPA: class I SAM-dependent methyltransferase [Propylenella sp.]|nr:class I SAM-dependent methyltransferase [Propylenella sp.]
MPARLRSLLTFGLSDLVASVHERLAAIDKRVQATLTETAELRTGLEERLGRIELKLEGLDEGAASESLRRDMAEIRTMGERLGPEMDALRALVTGEAERAQRKLSAGLSSAVNLLSVVPHLNLQGVVPRFSHHGWEITGELAAFLFHLVRRHRPNLILELGSGSSTVLLAAAARANGRGRVISIEHDPQYRDRTAQSLEQTELSDWVQLVEVPLVEQQVGGRTVQWYHLVPLLRHLTEKIDLLFIDGPPGRIQPLSRYPALPVLSSRLSTQAQIVIDDGGRDDEARMIELWRELEIPFVSETLAFLPRSPILLKMGAKQAEIAELRRLKDLP